MTAEFHDDLYEETERGTKGTRTAMCFRKKREGHNLCRVQSTNINDKTRIFVKIETKLSSVCKKTRILLNPPARSPLHNLAQVFFLQEVTTMLHVLAGTAAAHLRLLQMYSEPGRQWARRTFSRVYSTVPHAAAGSAGLARQSTGAFRRCSVGNNGFTAPSAKRNTDISGARGALLPLACLA